MPRDVRLKPHRTIKKYVENILKSQLGFTLSYGLGMEEVRREDCAKGGHYYEPHSKSGQELERENECK